MINPSLIYPHTDESSNDPHLVNFKPFPLWTSICEGLFRTAAFLRGVELHTVKRLLVHFHVFLLFLPSDCVASRHKIWAAAELNTFNDYIYMVRTPIYGQRRKVLPS